MNKSLFLLLFLSCFQLAAQKQYIQCGRLIDGKSDKVRREMTVIVADGRIESVEKGFLTPENEEDRLIDCRHLTVMPGLMDMHVHIEGETSPDHYLKRFTQNREVTAFESLTYAERTLMAGFTTVRDLGGSGVNIALRDAINKGLVTGPRIFTCGKSIASTGGHADPTSGFRRTLEGDAGPREGVADGVAQCTEAVRWRYKNGADLIKITGTGGVLSMAKNGENPQFSREEMNAIVQTAKDYGFHVAVHAHGAEGMKRAVLAGVHSIEHGTLMTPEIMDLMIEKGTWYVPTITAGKFVAEKAKIPGYYPEVIRPKALAIGPKIQATFARAYKRGVQIAFGTDAGVYPHGENWKEFLYMTEAGMPPMEAIQSATMGGAMLLGMEDELGSVEAGKRADIIAVEGNPLENIAQMKQVRFVMKDGVIYKSEL